MFLILIAVALFAALSYAVTKTSRTSPGGIDKEANKTDISVLLQYITSIQERAMYMRVTGGVKNPTLYASFDGNCSLNLDECIFSKVHYYRDDDIRSVLGIDSDGMWERSYTDWTMTPPRRRAYLQIFDVNQDVCEQINEFVQIADIPTMSNDRDYDDLSFDNQSQPLLCAQVSNSPQYNILMKIYETEYDVV